MRKRILVTGADGFIGSHMADTLVAEGAAILAVCQYDSLNHWGWLENLPCISQIAEVAGRRIRCQGRHRGSRLYGEIAGR